MQAIETTQQIVLSVRMKGDSIGPQTGDVVLSGMTLQDYDPAESYEKNELILKDGVIYRANEAVDPGEFDPEDWESLTDITIRLSDFEPEHTYAKDETCVYQDMLWRAKADFTSGTEFDLDDWEGIDTVDVDVMNFTPFNIYDQYEVIVEGGKLYRAKEAFTSGQEFRLKDWELLSDLIVEDFKPNNDYHANNLISVSNSLYRAKEDFTSGAEFDPDDWEQISAVGISEFSADTYYPAGTLITYDNKLYTAKDDFTSESVFDPADWTLQSDTLAEDFDTQTAYEKDHIVVYQGQIYRAKASFTSGNTFNESDWELLSPDLLKQFEPNKYYIAGQLIEHDGDIYKAKSNFESGNTFNINNWDKLGAYDLQSIYEDSTRSFSEPAEVRPGQDQVFEEHLCAAGTDSHILNFTDNQGGTTTLRTGVKLDQTSAARLVAERTGTNRETAGLEVARLDAKIEAKVQQQGSHPWTEFSMEDDEDERLAIVVKSDNSAVTMTSNIQKAFTDALLTASANQFGTVKPDGTTIVSNNGVLSSKIAIQGFAANTAYAEGALIKYNGDYYVAKQSFTSGSAFNMSDWQPIKQTVETYTTGVTYYVGDLVAKDGQIYWAKENILSAPATMDTNYWNILQLSGGNITVNVPGAQVITSNTLEGALAELDADTAISVKPLDNITFYRLTTQAYGTNPPAPVAGKTIICLFTE